MNTERLTVILDKVLEKHKDGGFTNESKELMFQDMKSIMRGIQKTENLIECVEVNPQEFCIYIEKEEDIKSLPFLPYLDQDIEDSGKKVWLLYLMDKETGMGEILYGLEFLNHFRNTLSPGIGVEVALNEVFPVGIYTYGSNKFEGWK